jgi:hypothetical protein
MHRLEVQIVPHGAELDVVIQFLVSNVNGFPSCQHTIHHPGRLPSEVRHVDATLREGFVQGNDQIEKVILLLYVDGHVHVAHRRFLPRRDGPVKH